MKYEWDKLRDAYGSAETIPALIQQFSTCPTQQLESELWGRLCHQGTVYSASYAAMLLLVSASEHLDANFKRSVLMLSAEILGSEFKYETIQPEPDTAAVVPKLSEYLEGCLSDSDLDDTEFVYVLKAIADAQHNRLACRLLGNLAGRWTDGECPNCHIALVISTAEHLVCDERRWMTHILDSTHITPTDAGHIPSDYNWMIEKAEKHSRRTVIRQMYSAFGSAECPNCQHSLSVFHALKAAM